MSTTGTTARTITIPDPGDAAVRDYADRYFGEWSMAEARFSGLAEHVRAADLRAHVREHAARAGDGPSARDRGAFPFDPSTGIATIAVRGVMMKGESSLFQCSSTPITRLQVRAAMREDDVRGVLLVLDSPGGTVDGTEDLADDVAALAAAKPTVAYAEDACHSAAYFVAAQAGRVMVNAGGYVGSIGVFGVVTDSSKAAEKQGYAVHLITSGGFKGQGTPGVPVDDAFLERARGIVSERRDRFVAAIARGRGMGADDVAALATGDIFNADRAAALGLVDAVGSIDDARDELLRMIDDQDTQTDGDAIAEGHDEPDDTEPTEGTDDMNDTTQTTATQDDAATSNGPAAPEAATLAELKNALPNRSDRFYVGCLEREDTLDQAIARAAGIDEAKAEAGGAAGGSAPVTTHETKAQDGDDMPDDEDDDAKGEEMPDDDDASAHVRLERAITHAQETQKMTRDQATDYVSRKKGHLVKAAEREAAANLARSPRRSA